jgi:hypothetical protein
MKSWKWLAKRRLQERDDKRSVPAPSAEVALAALLHDHVQKGYDREIEDNESMWRSLPLFAVLMGFAGASLNFLATSAPAPDRRWWAFVVYTLIVIDVGFYGWGIRHLFTIIRPRKHRYIANDRTVRSFALDLLRFHAATGAAEAQADAAAARETREYLIKELAEASTHIQTLNQRKAYARAQALFWLGIGFIFWFAVSSAIIVDEKFFHSKDIRSGPESRTATQGRGLGATNRAGFPAADAAPPAVHRGGSEPAISKENRQLNAVADAASNGSNIRERGKDVAPRRQE